MTSLQCLLPREAFLITKMLIKQINRLLREKRLIVDGTLIFEAGNRLEVFVLFFCVR